MKNSQHKICQVFAFGIFKGFWVGILGNGGEENLGYFRVLGLFPQNSSHPFEFHPWIPCIRRFTSPLHGMSLFCVDPSHFVYLEFIEVPNRSFPFAGCFSLNEGLTVFANQISIVTKCSMVPKGYMVYLPTFRCFFCKCIGLGKYTILPLIRHGV